MRAGTCIGDPYDLPMEEFADLLVDIEETLAEESENYDPHLAAMEKMIRAGKR